MSFKFIAICLLIFNICTYNCCDVTIISLYTYTVSNIMYLCNYILIGREFTYDNYNNRNLLVFT